MHNSSLLMYTNATYCCTQHPPTQHAPTLCFFFPSQALGGNLQFQPDTLDVQMGTTNTALIAVVTGNLKVTFFLLKDAMVRVIYFL